MTKYLPTIDDFIKATVNNMFTQDAEKPSIA